MNLHKIKELKDWYEKYERRFSTITLAFGFVFDSLTLQRIDALRENLWLAMNLVLAGVLLVLINREKEPIGQGTWKHFFLFSLLQFSFGALLGGFFIFYFQSATIAAAWPFLLLLVGAMVANELFTKRYALLALHFSFLYLSIFAFSIFLLPLLIHSVGVAIFLLSGGVSLAVIGLYALAFKYFAPHKFAGGKEYLQYAVAAIFISLNLLYFTNLIPPIPLSLKDAGVYHSLGRRTDGSYVVSGEERGFFSFFRLRETIQWRTGSPLYAYSAVYLPAAINTSIVHEWQYKDERTGRWTTSTRISLPLSGGRPGGFRTYSTKSNLTPGLWRVNVATPRGALIGRISFRVTLSETSVPLETSVKN